MSSWLSIFCFWKILRFLREKQGEFLQRKKRHTIQSVYVFLDIPAPAPYNGIRIKQYMSQCAEKAVLCLPARIHERGFDWWAYTITRWKTLLKNCMKRCIRGLTAATVNSAMPILSHIRWTSCRGWQPGKYVVTKAGGAISKADSLRFQHITDIRAAMIRAVQVVKDYPRHWVVWKCVPCFWEQGTFFANFSDKKTASPDTKSKNAAFICALRDSNPGPTD